MLSLPHYPTTPVATSPFAPLYLAFATTELHDVWLAILRSYAQPEILCNGIPHNVDVSAEAARDRYRVWRGVKLEVMEGRGLLGGRSGGSSPVTGYSQFPRPNPLDEMSGTKETSYDHEIFCEIFIDSILAGRTTAKTAAATFAYQSASNSPFDATVLWHEQFRWPDLPYHNILRINVWKTRSEKEKHSGHANTASSSGKDRLKSSVSSSISGGVALISATTGGNKKEREPVLVGKIDIILPNFRRGEWVEGWWATAGPSSSPIGDWGYRTPEIKLKVKVEE